MSRRLESAVAELVDAIRAELEANPERLYSVNEACELLNVSRATFYAMANRGELETVLTGGKRQVIASELRRLQTSDHK